MANIGISRLTAESGDYMKISFNAEFHPATPGSSAWSIIAKNIRIDLMVKKFGSKTFLARIRGITQNPYAVIQEYVTLQRITDSGYSGEASIPLYIKTGSSGQIMSFNQFLEFDRLVPDLSDQVDPESFPRDRLIDPISRTSVFQIDMFAATPFANTDMGNWSSMV